MPSTFTKRSTGQLDYKFDWSDWLTGDETISTYTITPDTGLTIEDDSLTDGDTSITIWVSGGVGGQNYKVVAEIVTSQSREDKRVMTFRRQT